MNERYMQMAIDIAQAAHGQTTPNPVVGSVIVKDNQILGFGAHLKAGEWHAERHALHMAGEKAKGATMYVTLEPCSHHGRTSPCADAVIEAGIKEVYIASVDPNPKVAGGGIAKLRKAGITVHIGLLNEEATKINKTFFHFIQTKKPYVTLKSGTSIDGKIATKTGESQWITNNQSRADVHRLRHTNDGILVGINTVLTDDPSLTTRLEGGGKHPTRIVLDRQLKIPISAKLVKDQQAPTWIVTLKESDEAKKQALRNAGVKVIEYTDDIHIPQLLLTLGELGISSLLVEGGATINDAFLRTREFQEIIVYVAPLLIGGKNAPSSFGGVGIQSLEAVPKLKLQKIEQFMDDIKLIYVKGEE